MDKSTFTTHMKNWLTRFAISKFQNEYNVKIMIPQSNLDIISNSDLSKIPNVGLMKFKPDVLGILVNKKNPDNIELIFLNRDIKKFGLRDIGEMLCYCRIAKPKLAIMASLKGLSPAVDRMINHSKNEQLISYEEKKILIFRWDEGNDKIDEYSVTPVALKSFLN